MKWSSFLIPASIVAARLPLDRFIAPHRDKVKALEEFAATLPTNPQSPRRPPITNPGITQTPTESPMPTTEETVGELRRELAKEMYRFQLDLARGCKIAGKPCDCCEKHPPFGIEALAEELIPMDPSNPIYLECIQWTKVNAHKLTLEASASGLFEQEYPHMAATWRNFRKQLMGTERLGAMVAPKQELSLEDAKAEASRIAAEEVEKQSQSAEAKCPHCGGKLDKDGCCKKCGICVLG